MFHIFSLKNLDNINRMLNFAPDLCRKGLKKLAHDVPRLPIQP